MSSLDYFNLLLEIFKVLFYFARITTVVLLSSNCGILLDIVIGHNFRRSLGAERVKIKNKDKPMIMNKKLKYLLILGFIIYFFEEYFDWYLRDKPIITAIVLLASLIPLVFYYSFQDVEHKRHFGLLPSDKKTLKVIVIVVVILIILQFLQPFILSWISDNQRLFCAGS